MPAKGKTQLSDLEVFEVSLVPEGANGKKFFLMKSRNGEAEMPKSQQEILKSLMEGKLKNEEQIDKVLKSSSLSEDEQSAVKGALRLLGGIEKELPEELSKELGGLMTPAKKEEEEVNKELDLSTLPKEVQERLDAVFKANDAIVKENEKLKENIEKEKDVRITKEFQDKAAVYKSIGADKDELGSVLKEINQKCGEETLKKVENVLKAANEAISKGKVFDEVGSSGSTGESGADAWAQIEKAAEGLVQKSEKALSKADAITKFLETSEGKKLYERYENERAGLN